MNTVREMFDRIAPRYDLANRMMSAGLDKRWRKRALDRLAPQPGERLLDLACGTGDGSVGMHERARSAHIIALDFSAGMLERFRTPGPHVRLQADARALPLASASVNRAFCGFGLRNVPELPLALAELARVLVPGGKLVVLDFFATGKRRFLVDGVARVIGGLVSGEPHAYAYLAESVRRFVTVPAFCELLAAAGFKDIDAEPLFPQGVATLIEAVRA